jgi:RNA polymerase sigma-70 factor (ECF subfamily)
VAVVEGETVAFAALYEENHRLVLHHCRCRLGNGPDAADATQETFLRAWRAIDRYDPSRPIYPWLRAIATNVCIDVLRQRRTTVPIQETDGDPCLDLVVDRGPIEDALARLPERQREVLWLREYAGWTYERIAEDQRLDLSAVKSLLWRARQSLRREFLALAAADARLAVAGFVMRLASGPRVLADRLFDTVGTVGTAAGAAAAVATAVVVPVVATRATPPSPPPAAVASAAAAPAGRAVVDLPVSRPSVGSRVRPAAAVALPGVTTTSTVPLTTTTVTPSRAVVVAAKQRGAKKAVDDASTTPGSSCPEKRRGKDDQPDADDDHDGTFSEAVAGEEAPSEIDLGDGQAGDGKSKQDPQDAIEQPAKQRAHRGEATARDQAARLACRPSGASGAKVRAQRSGGR